MFVPGDAKGSVSFDLKDSMADLLIGGCVRVKALMDLLHLSLWPSPLSQINKVN